MCFIKIHKENSSKVPKYEWSLDLLTVIFDCWIFITKSIIKVTQRCYSWLNIHVFYQNPQGELFNEWSLDLLTVIFDTWIFITNTKGTQRFPFWMNKNLICTAVTCFLKVATFIYKSHTSMTLFKHELMLHTFLMCL